MLPIDRLTRDPAWGCVAPAEAPFALVEKVRGALRLCALDPQALALGLTPGLMLADARARVPELAVFDADPVADQIWLDRIATACERYSPLVEIAAPDGVTIDMTGGLHLHGGERGLAAALESWLPRWSIRAHHAFAGTPEAAQALARYQTGPAPDEGAALRRLPVAALGADDDTLTALRRAGLRTIGDLADRPSGPIAARFGEKLTVALDRLLGRADSRLTPRRRLPELNYERRFAEPIGRVVDALAALGELAEAAAGELAQRDRGARRVVARLFRTDGVVRDLAVETGRPSRDPQGWLRLLSERIETLADPIDPGFGFDLVRLHVPVTEPLQPTQLALQGGEVSEEAMTALIDRLSVRLGRARVRRFVPRDSHFPEQAALALPAVERPDAAAWPSPEPGEPPARPIHLFDPPQPIEVMAEVPDGPPRRFRWRRNLHEVTRFEGPERIAPSWWRDRGGRLLTRDYYRVEDARGRRFWLFRHGLYDRETADPRWYVHGLFA